MEQNIQTLIDLVTANENLSAEEKAAFISKLKEADKKIEVIEFKLDRTEKVKRTTAILLEETIEELENKRKSIEAQNRELEIEASLERVRTVAMSMNKTDDVLSICKIMFTELKSLGFDELRNALINFFDDEHNALQDYDYADFSGGHVQHLPYHSHPTFENFQKRIRSSTDAFAELIVGENELESWKERRRQSGEYEDPRLENIAALYYYFYSIGVGAVGISTFSSLTEDKLKLLKRFRNVFDLAYRRYVDIKNAEAQTREAQIETALERVRAVAMSMMNSEDLLKVCASIFHQLTELGFDQLRCSQIYILNDEKQTFLDYDFFGDLGSKISEIKYGVDERVDDFIEHIRSGGENVVHLQTKGEEFLSWRNFLVSTLHQQPEPKLEKAIELNYYHYSIDNGALSISTFDQISDEQINILQRLKNVFSLSYKRYTDIALAEAQAREAKIETALERVRTVAMSMMRSEDLLQVAESIYFQLDNLGFTNLRNAQIYILNDETQKILTYDFFGDLGGKVTTVAYGSHEKVDEFLNNIRSSGETLVHTQIIDPELDNWRLFLRETLHQEKEPRLEEAKELNYYHYSTGNGALSVSTFSDISEEQIMIVKRLKNVFSLSYKRYSDIARAEAQAREAKIQLALERVRARTMAMQHSDELAEIASLLFNQVHSLGMPVISCGFNIWKQGDKTCNAYMSNEVGDILQPFKMPLTESPVLIHFINSKLKEESFYAEEMSGETLAAHYKYMLALPVFAEIAKDFLKAGFTFPEYQINNVANFTYGNLIFITHKPVAESNEIFIRFAQVFEQTYTRFLDLQKAEAQAREAQIEAALERIRSRAMAMRTSDELNLLIGVVFAECTKLNMQLDRGFIMTFDKNTNDSHWWMVGADATDMPISVLVKYHEYAPSLAILKGWKEREQKWSYVLEGDNKRTWSDYCFTKTGLAQLPDFVKDNMRLVDSVILNASFQNFGCIMLSSFEPLKEEHFDLLMRVSKVFDLTYTRFLDLQKAEAQAREAQIELGLERVRARAMAMQKSGELSDLVATVLHELTKLDFSLTFCIINIYNEPDNSNMVWAANPQEGKAPESYYMKFEDYPFHDAMMSEWKAQTPKFVYVMEGDEKKVYDDYLYTATEFRRFPDEVKTANRALERYVASFVFSQFGGLQTVGVAPLSDESLDILYRFGKVFDQTYTRFLDLQKAEAQAREAQIEAALEKTRSRSLAMHKSDELKEVVIVVFEKLKELGLVFENAGIQLFTEDSKDIVQWVAAPNLLSNPILAYLPYVKNELAASEILRDIWLAKEKKENIFNKSYSFNEKNKFFEYAGRYNSFTQIPQQVRDIQMQSTGYTYNLVAERHSAIWLDTYSFQIISVEDFNLLKRFVKVFEQSYVRFLDLQKAEAQAREATIEAALERVRSRSIGMQKSDELQEVIKIVYEQFIHLKINVDHAGFVIDYIPKSDWHFWIADEHAIPNKITHPYFDSVWANQFNEAKEKGIDFFASNLNFEEKNKFYEELLSYVPNLPEESKNFYLACPAVAISTALMDDVSLYIENFSGIDYTDDENAVLMRFAKVFQQTYTRFLDLQKAEAQAREAQIEASLERVRARTMAMHNSDDVGTAIATLFSELERLGVENLRCGIANINTDKTMGVWSVTNVADLKTARSAGIFNTNDHLMWQQMFKEWESKKESFYYYLVDKEKEDYIRILNAAPDYLPQPLKELPDMHFQTYYFNEGAIWTFSSNPHSEDSRQLMKRFTSVFSLTFRRYRDLQKAETQAKEAQIEAALEKVRSRTMAMQSSNELQETAAVLFQEFKKLGTENIYQVTIGIYNEEEKLIDFRVTSWTGSGEQENRSFQLDMNEPTLLQPSVTAWRANEKSLVVDLSGDALEGWLNYRNKMSGITVRSEDTAGRRVISIAYFSKGHLSISTPVPPPQETIKTLERFATVFDGTYTRFQDLEKAEAQAREAQIETALERVRSRTLAMQRSDELAETAAVLFKQLIGLGISPNRLYISIMKDDKGETEFWITDEDGSKVSMAYEDNLNNNTSFKKMVEGWKQQKKSLVIDMQGKELEDYFQYLTSIHVPFKGGLEQKRRVQHLAYFSKGFIGMASPEEQPASTLQLLERFAYVFNLTFTRFNDLKIAEAHALQAEHDLIAIKEAKQKAEAALTELQATQKQLIQSEKMASLGELTAGIAHEIQNPLNFVNNFSEVSNELIGEMNDELNKGDIKEAMSIASDIQQNLEKINHHGKRAEAIVKGMLQHSRTNTGQKELTDINILTDEYLRLAYHGLRAKDKTFNAILKTSFDETIGNVSIIPQDIGRVILNLITNAFYTVTEKKKDATDNYEPTVLVSTKKMHDAIEISIADNGTGIPQKIVDKIFQPFFTTKPTGQGTGLGLSLVYDIIKAHDGKIKVETKECEGSEFIILLPA